MANVNARMLNMLNGEFNDVANALVDGGMVWQYDHGEKDWFPVEQINLLKPRTDYHIGEQAPE